MNGVQVIGLEEISDVLKTIAPKNARNLMRATIQGVASEIAKKAKQNAPKNSGDLKRSIKAKRKRGNPNTPVSEVLSSAYYWRFVEYGTGLGKGSHVNENYAGNAHPFIRPAADSVKENLDEIIAQQFGKKLEGALKRARKKAAKA